MGYTQSKIEEEKRIQQFKEGGGVGGSKNHLKLDKI